MPNTHCLPSGSLGTAELPVSNVTTGTISTIPATTGVGNRRGIAVLLGGLPVSPTVIPPVPSGEFSLTFANDLAADGWTVIQPPYMEEFYVSEGSVGIFNDINNDAGNGSRYLTNVLHWWDHVTGYIHANFPGWPIAVVGGSWGGWHALQLAANKTSTMIAYGAQFPVTFVENIGSVIFGGKVNYGQLNSSGADITPTLLNSVTIPGAIGYGTADSVVGYSGTTTVAVGSNGVAASAVATLNVASNTGFVIPSAVSALVTVTGLTGGTGRATYQFTGTGTNTLTGATLLSGSGTLATGNPVTQSTTLALITAQQAAQPSNQVTVNATADNHLWLADDTTFFTNWFTNTVDPLAPKVF